MAESSVAGSSVDGSSVAGSSFLAQWRWLSWVLMAIVATAALIVGSTGAEDPKTGGERVAELAATIRCPQCRGQSVAESNVTIAREIRADIRTRIAAGETEDEIRQVYIDRFGRSIVLTPDADGLTGLVWIVPVVAASLAVAAVGLALQRWRSEAAGVGSASPADRELVTELRATAAGAGAAGAGAAGAGAIGAAVPDPASEAGTVPDPAAGAATARDPAVRDPEP